MKNKYRHADIQFESPETDGITVYFRLDSVDGKTVLEWDDDIHKKAETCGLHIENWLVSRFSLSGSVANVFSESEIKPLPFGGGILGYGVQESATGYAKSIRLSDVEGVIPPEIHAPMTAKPHVFASGDGLAFLKNECGRCGLSKADTVAHPPGWTG